MTCMCVCSMQCPCLESVQIYPCMCACACAGSAGRKHPYVMHGCCAARRRYVSAFLSEVIHAHVDRITHFTPSTWLLFESYVLLMAFALYSCAPWRSFTLALDWIWYGATVYLGYRLLLYATLLRRISRELSRERNDPPCAWPQQWLDRILFPIIGPGVTGFAPWGVPSEAVGIRCMQASLLVQFYRVGQFVTDPVRHA